MTDTEVFLTEAKIADLKPIRRNFRKNAHLHTSPEVLAPHMLPDSPDNIRGGSIEEHTVLPQSIKDSLGHNHEENECQCSLLEYHRTKSSSLEVKNSLMLQTSLSANLNQMIGVPQAEPSLSQAEPSLSDKGDMLAPQLSSAIESALPSLLASPFCPVASPVKTVSSTLPKVRSLGHISPGQISPTMYSPNMSEIGGLKSPSGRKFVSSSSASVNLGREKWNKV